MDEAEFQADLACVNRALATVRGWTAGLNGRQVEAVTKLVGAQSKATPTPLLLEMKTGEGKSAVVAAFAAIWLLHTKRRTGDGNTALPQVHIITSSPVLAKRDSVEEGGWRPFFTEMGLTADTCIADKMGTGTKSCYDCDVVYGDVLTFAGDVLRHHHMAKDVFGVNARGVVSASLTRAGTNVMVVVDEVDSLLIDEHRRSTRLSQPMPGSFLFQRVFLLLSRVFIVNKDRVEEVRMKDHLTTFLQNIVSSGELQLPDYHTKFVLEQAPTWAESCVRAGKLQRDVDYAVVPDPDTGKLLIAPVDYATTGTLQPMCQWGRGVHTFLQIKEDVSLTVENFTSSFMSQPAFFSRYGLHITGVTGTAGSAVDRSSLKQLYALEIHPIAPQCPGVVHELPHVECSDRDSWKRTLSEKIRVISTVQPMLVVFQTIRDVVAAKADLEAEGVGGAHLRTYTSGSPADALQAELNRPQRPGDVLLTTLLAGRGTDIAVDADVADGLCVVLVFVPDSLRAQLQIIGRTGRNGRNGSWGFVTYAAEPLDGPPPTIHSRLQRRDEQERASSIHLEARVREMKKDDDVFALYSSKVSEYRRAHGASQSRSVLTSTVNLIDENWAMWLQSRTGDAAPPFPAIFDVDQNVNPFGLVHKASAMLADNTEYDAVCASAGHAARALGEWGGPAHVVMAQAASRYFRRAKNSTVDQTKVDQARRHVADALLSLTSCYLPATASSALLIDASRDFHELPPCARSVVEPAHLLHRVVDALVQNDEATGNRENRHLSTREHAGVANFSGQAQADLLFNLGITQPVLEIVKGRKDKDVGGSLILVAATVVQVVAATACMAVGNVANAVSLVMNAIETGKEAAVVCAGKQSANINLFFTKQAITMVVKMAIGGSSASFSPTQIAASNLSQHVSAVLPAVLPQLVSVVAGVSCEVVAKNMTKVVTKKLVELTGVRRVLSSELRHHIMSELTANGNAFAHVLGLETFVPVGRRQATRELLRETTDLAQRWCMGRSNLQQAGLHAVSAVAAVATAVAPAAATVAPTVANLSVDTFDVQRFVSEFGGIVGHCVSRYPRRDDWMSIAGWIVFNAIPNFRGVMLRRGKNIRRAAEVVEAGLLRSAADAESLCRRGGAVEGLEFPAVASMLLDPHTTAIADIADSVVAFCEGKISCIASTLASPLASVMIDEAAKWVADQTTVTTPDDLVEVPKTEVSDEVPSAPQQGRQTDVSASQTASSSGTPLPSQSKPPTVAKVYVIRRSFWDRLPFFSDLAHSALLLEDSAGKFFVVEYMGDGKVYSSEVSMNVVESHKRHITCTFSGANTPATNSATWEAQKRGLQVSSEKAISVEHVAERMQAFAAARGDYNLLTNNCHMAQQDVRTFVFSETVDHAYTPPSIDEDMRFFEQAEHGRIRSSAISASCDAEKD